MISEKVNPRIGGEVPGLNFAISSNTVMRIVPELITHGSYAHPWLGTRIAAVGPFISNALGLDDAQGAYIQSVGPKEAEQHRQE